MYGGRTGNIWGDALYGHDLKEMSRFLSSRHFLGQAFVDVPDRGLKLF